MPDAPTLGGEPPCSSTPTCSRRPSTARSCTRSWWPSWPRAGAARTRPRPRGMVSRRRRQAVAPEGHRPRPRRHVALADLDGRRHRLRAQPAPLHRQGQPQGAPRRAAGALSIHAERSTLARARRRGVRRAVDQAGGRRCSTRTAAAPCWSCWADDELAAAKSFRNLAARERAARRRRRRGRPRRRGDARRSRRERSTR